ncbi:MAG TPA: TlpA disulfide reductase family protein [Pyrinomonadaceae bacterium]|nr:TlpA disulfide reductase family protein [Pyrinomonadaceae bacterium]
MSKVVLIFCLIFSFVSVALAQTSGPVKLKGQVVCSVCWFEAEDRKKTQYGTAADMTCAEECSEQGVPQALAVEDEKGFTLYFLEPGAFKPKAKDFLDLVPKFVEIEGIVRTQNEKRYLRVNKLTVIDDAPPASTEITDAPPLELADLAGTKQSLANYRGRVVVLNFWATWCGPCIKEMPDLSAIQNDYGALGVQVIGAGGDEPSEAASVLAFVRKLKVNFPVWLGATTDDMKRFGLGGVLPATAVVDRDGKIVLRVVGVVKPAELRKKLDKLVAPKAAVPKPAEKALARNVSLVPA